MVIIYRTLTELVHAWAELCDKGEQASPEGVRVADLVKTYFNAQNSPPEGVIGVGAITYAEDMIVAKQGASEHCWRVCEKDKTFGRDNRVLRKVSIEYGKMRYSDKYGSHFEADMSVTVYGIDYDKVDAWVQLIKTHAGEGGAVKITGP